MVHHNVAVLTKCCKQHVLVPVAGATTVGTGNSEVVAGAASIGSREGKDVGATPSRQVLGCSGRISEGRGWKGAA